MAGRVDRLLTAGPAQVFWALAALLIGYWSIPGGWILDIHKLEVQPSWSLSESRAPAIVVDRTVRATVSARWYADVQRLDGSVWRDACPTTPTGRAIYEPGVDVPTGIDLDWWTAGQCPAAGLPPGTYRLRTTWVIEMPFGYHGRSFVMSNLFVVRGE